MLTSLLDYHRAAEIAKVQERHLPRSIRDRLVARELPGGLVVHQLEHDMQAIIAREDTGDDGEMVLNITASTGQLDRMRDVIDPAGWDLDNYRRNPVMLADHRYSVAYLVGQAISCDVKGCKPKKDLEFTADQVAELFDVPRYMLDATVEGLARAAKNSPERKGKLRLRARMDPPTSNEMTRMVREKVTAGSLRTVSVGFRPRAWQKILDKEGEWTGGYLFTEVELLEVSFVVVPANPFATIDGKSDRPDGTSQAALDTAKRIADRFTLHRIERSTSQ